MGNNMENNLLNALKEFFKSRKVTKKNGLLFYLYFFLVIIAIGGAGIWASIFIEIYNDCFLHQNIYLSIMTFSLPLVTAFAIDIVKMEVDKQIKTIFQIFLFVLVIISIIAFTVLLLTKNNWAYLPAIIFALLSLFFWWIVNCDNKNLYDEDYYKNQSKHTNDLEKEINNI
jgi:uncharacterized membrane protein